MVLILLIIGGILIVAAFRNSQGSLFTALYQDIPAFVVWAAAIFAIGAIGFIPGLKPVSRAILALVLTVIVLRNYQQIIAGFQNVWQNPPKAVPAEVKSGDTLPGSPSATIPLFPDFGGLSLPGAEVLSPGEVPQ